MFSSFIFLFFCVLRTGMVRISKKVYINVSGTVYETFEETLQRFPNTLLGSTVLRIRYYDCKTDVFYFDRSRVAFEAILFYYQSNGCLVRPPWIPMEIFEFECIFFRLGENAIKRMKEREGYDTQKKILVQDADRSCRAKMWELFEKPESSLVARIYTFLSMLFILFAITMDCFETTLSTNQSHESWELTKLSLNMFFAVEFILRFMFSPSKLMFVRKTLNIVDFIAIFPSFLTYALELKKLKSILFVRILRTFRVLRLVRLSRSFETLSVVLHILIKSLSDLLMLIFCMLISCTVFGSIIYYSEHIQDQKTSPMISIPEAMYFAMQTVVSIGYGDLVPITLAGKIASAITAIFGALTMTVPLLSLGGKYFATYTKTFKVKLTAQLINTPGPEVLRKSRAQIRNNENLSPAMEMERNCAMFYNNPQLGLPNTTIRTRAMTNSSIKSLRM